ncbi:hypothetical protein EJ03DRAFT_144377 [Teratosphaeria nubilosa]|uniref:Ferric oxidoreductase domain-containing protein n=1 Tax=Teratosphaeria nubilosa TaxID=161662 RepID=A0A6G1L5Y9_9PEZI|nr:hypothetical protein EJ03DRAFT_144377 [Teratosphaeria nubilosa]
MQTIFAKRLGWMTPLNLCLVVLLGPKNTPLSPLTGYSYESINVLHRCCRYTAVVYVLLHAIIYATGLAKARVLLVVRSVHEYVGAVAGVAMVVILVTAIGPVRRGHYELFYVLHVVLVALILAAAAFHVYQPPDISPKTIVIIGIAAGCWLLDRSLRLSRGFCVRSKQHGG